MTEQILEQAVNKTEEKAQNNAIPKPFGLTFFEKNKEESTDASIPNSVPTGSFPGTTTHRHGGSDSDMGTDIDF